ncbi:MAG: S8 family serine peptidase [Desulfosarcina sp.]
MKACLQTWTVILICLISGPMLLPAADTVVLITDDRLTLRANDQELSDILGRLSDQGIRIRIDPRINPQITASFDNRPIGSAIAGMLKSVDYALIWEKDRHSPTDRPRLREIRIFFKGQEARVQPLEKDVNLTVVQEADGTYHVKDTLLVQLDPDMTDASLAAMLDRLGASVIDGYAPLGILRLRLPHGSDVPAIAGQMAHEPGIRNAEPDYAYPLQGSDPGPKRPEAKPSAPALTPSTGTTVVAILDSGLRAGYADSPFVQAVYDAVSHEAKAGDELGHGTQMTLIASGAVNPLGSDSDMPEGSPIVAVRAFDDNGFTSTYTLMRGIDYAIEKGARVLSLSWGSDRDSLLLESATRYAAAKGLILVAAVGNAPTGKPVYPAAYENVIGVGALTPDGEMWNRSNFGDFVALSAPGTADLPVGYQGDPGIYAGTSIAAAYTARRVAAILDQHPEADRATILRLLGESN